MRVSRFERHAASAGLATALVGALATVWACGSAAVPVTGTPDPSAAEAFRLGDAVSCHWKQGRAVYPGRVTELRAGMLFVAYDDGDREEIAPTLCTNLSGPRPATTPAAGCVKDTDCKGERICENGACVAPH